MNKECNLVLGSFPLKYIFGLKNLEVDCIIISSATKVGADKIKNSESNDALNSIKDLILEQNQKIESQNKKFDSI